MLYGSMDFVLQGDLLIEQLSVYITVTTEGPSLVCMFVCHKSPLTLISTHSALAFHLCTLVTSFKKI